MGAGVRGSRDARARRRRRRRHHRPETFTQLCRRREFFTSTALVLLSTLPRSWRPWTSTESSPPWRAYTASYRIIPLSRSAGTDDDPIGASFTPGLLSYYSGQTLRLIEEDGKFILIIVWAIRVTSCFVYRAGVPEGLGFEPPRRRFFKSASEAERRMRAADEEVKRRAEADAKRQIEASRVAAANEVAAAPVRVFFSCCFLSQLFAHTYYTYYSVFINSTQLTGLPSGVQRGGGRRDRQR